MLFDGHGILTRQPDQFEQQAKQILVVLILPFRALEYLAEVFHRMLDGSHIVADEKSPDGRSTNHDHLEWQ